MSDEELRAVSETTPETTTEMTEKPFDPEIDEKVLFCPYDGNDHIVTIVGKPENGTTKWLTSEGPVNACYLKQLNPEEYGYMNEDNDSLREESGVN